MAKVSEPLPRLVYDCTYGIGEAGAIPLVNERFNEKSKYFEKLPNFYTPKSP